VESVGEEVVVEIVVT